MATIEAGLNDVEAWGGEITQLPPGEYQFKIKAADVEQKEKDGKVISQLVVDYEVLSGAFAGKPGKAWFTLNFAKDTPRRRLKSLVTAAGITVSPNGSFDSNQLVGCKLNADVIHESYESGPDPITGVKIEKTAVRIVNERPFRDVVTQPNGATSQGAGKPASVSVGASLPGLSKAQI